MVAALRERGLQVVEQRESLTMHDGKVFELRNIVGIFRPQSPRRMVLAAHWDTRPFADMDADNPKARMDGANDGASGVAVLLELGRHLDSLPSDWGVDLVFFDLEDYGVPEGG
jgi:Predicted aminopeptidases